MKFVNMRCGLKIFLSSLFFALILCDSAFGQAKRHVLVLHSYNKGLEWTDNEDQGIKNVLRLRSDEIEVHTEYMDSKRVAGDDGFAGFYEFLQLKYAKNTFSCIICTDDDAFNLVFKNRADLFSGVPIVFCGVNFVDAEMLTDNRQRITGVVEAFDITATLRTALRLHPDTSRIVVINDLSTTGIANRKIIDALLPTFSNKVQIDFLGDQSMAELLNEVQSLKPGTLILLMTFSRDRLGESFDYNRSISLISEVATVPVYGVWDFYLGKGIVGGMLTSGLDQGKAAAEMAMRIVGGEKVENIPVITESPNSYMFDYRQMARFDVALQALPPGSLVINQPTTFMQVHAQLVWGGLATVIALLYIIFLLLGRMADRRHSVREMEKVHRQTTTILESIADGFVALDRELYFTYVNQEAEKIFGRRREDLLGHNYWQVFPFMVGTVVDEFFQRVFDSGVADELEYYRTGEAGWVNKWIALRAYPSENGGISLYFRDITEKKLADNERNRLATAIEQSAEGVFIADTNWTIQYVNPAFLRMTGYSRSELLGQHVRVLKCEAHDEKFYRQILVTLRSGRVWSGRIISRKKDGSTFQSEVTDSPVRDSYGNIINFVGISRDMTAELRLERELRQAQKMEAIGTLAGGIAHDFNNILSIIIGFTEMASLRLSDPDIAKNYLHKVLEASGRARDLVKQILAFSHRSEQEKKPLQFAVFVKEALKLLRPLLPTTVEIKQDILPQSERTVVFMDPTEIHQVLMNLCTNAAHAMREKGGTLTVRVADLAVDAAFAARHIDLVPGNYVCLSVSDTGHGMDAALIERIFDPYFTTKELGVGTGLGLPVVRGVIQGHGGAMSVYSEMGKGTTFNVFLPRQEGRVGAPPAIQEEFPAGSERILFVDDEKSMADLGRDILVSTGYSVTATTSSTHALEIFQQTPDAFDLLVTDMTMPLLNGHDLARDVRKIRPGLPVILCTGFSDQINEQSAFKAGIGVFLMKPYAVADLLRAIHKVLAK